MTRIALVAMLAFTLGAATPTSTLFKAATWRKMAHGVTIIPVLNDSGALTGWAARGTVCLTPDPAQVSGELPDVCKQAVVTLTPTPGQSTYLASVFRAVAQSAGAADSLTPVVQP